MHSLGFYLVQTIAARSKLLKNRNVVLRTSSSCSDLLSSMHIYCSTQPIVAISSLLKRLCSSLSWCPSFSQTFYVRSKSPKSISERSEYFLTARCPRRTPAPWLYKEIRRTSRSTDSFLNFIYLHFVTFCSFVST